MATKVKFLKQNKFNDAILFTGLPGIGLVGKITVDYLLKQFNAEKVAEITSDSFPPSVHTKAGLVELIKDEIYLYRFKNRDFLFLAGPVQPALDMRNVSMAEHYEFAETIIGELKKAGLKEVYTLAGINIGEKRMVTEPNVIVAATDEKMLDEWKKIGAIYDKPEGLISGAAGLVLGIGKEEGIRGACLMGETNARLVYGDHGAAKKVIELLVKKFGFKVDMSKIEKEASEIENAFTQMVKQFEENDYKPEGGLSYVR